MKNTVIFFASGLLLVAILFFVPRVHAASPGFYLIVGPGDLAGFYDGQRLDHTPAVSGGGLSMIWVVSEGDPPLGPDMEVFGRRYDVVWADPLKSELYDTIFPPHGADGHTPFGVFAGCEKEMGL